MIQIVGRTGTGSLPRTIAPPDHPLQNTVATFGAQATETIVIFSDAQATETTVAYLGTQATENAVSCSGYIWGESGGAMVLEKLPVPERPTNWDYSRARVFCACRKCWDYFDIFTLVYHFFLGDGPI